ncbi:Fur family transcriptional regulator [Brevundimonas sp. 2R-24]|uniref:Fur family transcriptional regulator n=1 Tax=Peiella sedimenti TaxID=3061083 RepID=A0ABT8SL25_9CAUL|nr:Fur family transcriptional regulator [Caulobacteraceae bacterium XZ-24]
MSETCGHDHAGPAGMAGRDLDAALAAAAARCEAVGQRMTAPRRRVLELLLKAGGPVKAYDLIGAYGTDGAAKPPTVYRALEFLESQGLAHRIASISAYTACTHDATDHAAAFLICDCCGATVEIAPPDAAAMRRAAEGQGYRIQRTTIEAHGLCGACAA